MSTLEATRKGKQFGLLGEKLCHSMSPRLHAIMGDNNYRLYEIPPSDVEIFIKYGAWDAINVTIPYKKTVMRFCDVLSPRAQAIGAVNTLVKTMAGIYGDNTDYAGFASMCGDTDFTGKKVLVLGSGGASATVQAVVKDGGAREVVVLSRTGRYNYGNLELNRDADIIINTTPVGMYPDTEASPLSLDGFDRLSAVLDVVYNPLRTRLVLDAQERGIKAVGGLRMLCTQAHRARKVFGCEPNISEAELYKKASEPLYNIVLVGMPGCGKSTVGKAIAQLTNRRFIDTDTICAEIAGMPVPDIITAHGEDYFRDIEQRAVAQACGNIGAVIATGGGAILRKQNRYAIKANGATVFLRRELSRLSRSGRPLSANDKALEEMYAKRLPLYQTADITVDIMESKQDTRQAVLNALAGFEL